MAEPRSEPKLAAESETAAPHSELRSLLESLPMSLILVEGTTVSWCNTEAARAIGVSEPSDLVNIGLRSLFPLVINEAEFLAEVLRGPITVTIEDVAQGRRLVEVVGQRRGRLSLLIFREVGAWLKSADSVDSKLAGLGMLVAGVAHEINNPLTFVLPALNEAMKIARQLPYGRAQEELTTLLDDALVGVLRVQKIAADLREFKRGDDAVSRTDVNLVVVETLRLADARLGGRVKSQHILGEPSEVLANPTRLGQVILNLVLNAAQAIPERSPEESSISVRTWKRDGQVYIAVEDNGTGIAKDDLDKIFDPFFSTKHAGTGLGLSICAGIVKRLGGWIEVDSEITRGSCFTVVLPLASEDDSSTLSRPYGERLPEVEDELLPLRAERSEPIRVLTVDDEPLVIRSVKRLLGSKAQITQAPGAWEAIRLLREGLIVDCIVSDMVMPEGGGIELWTWVKEHRPDLRNSFFFMTGMAPTVESEPDLPPTIHKPFSMEDLERRLGLTSSDVEK